MVPDGAMSSGIPGLVDVVGFEVDVVLVVNTTSVE